MESVDSDDYNEDDASLSADDQVSDTKRRTSSTQTLAPIFSPSLRPQVYEVTIFEAEDDDDSFDEDTEITEAVSLQVTQHTDPHVLVRW